MFDVFFHVNLCHDWFCGFKEFVVWWLVWRVNRRQIEVCFSPDVILCGWLGSKHQLTNYHLVWCSIWPKEAEIAILCEGEVDTERQTLPSRVVLNMTLRQTPMETCEEMMRGMPMCSKYEWRHNRDKREGNKISRWAFVRISVSVWRAHVQPACFCPHTRPNISKGNDWLVFCLDKNPTFVCLCRVLSLFFLTHYLSDICQGVHD